MAAPRALALLNLLLIISPLAYAGPGNLCAGNWFSGGAHSKFEMGPCIKISGIGAIQSPEKTIYIIDRSDLQNTVIAGPDGHLAYAEEVNIFSGKQRGLSVRTNTFCSTGQFKNDGTFLSIGGDNPGGGGFSIRALKAGGDFQIVGEMTSWRWYPTSQVMPNGKILVVGGSKQGVDMNRGQINNPTLEYFPRGKGEGAYNVDFLSKALPYNLYPNVHLLPSGKVFIFANDNYILWDSNANKVAANGVPIGAKGVSHSYPLTGTSVLFPLNAGTGYTPEIMICGGGAVAAKPRAGKVGNPNAGAHDGCHRIKPEDKNPGWVTEKMSAPRVMPNAVLLPDGSIMIMNGARSGYAGIPNFARGAVTTADHYDSRHHKWAGISLAASKIARLYHASAFLLHDATIWVSGSNPNSGILASNDIGQSQFRTEFFYPPYLQGGKFPKITKAPGAIGTGKGTFAIDFDGAGCNKVDVTLAYPGFSTHSTNHGMRNVDLEVAGLAGKGPYTVTVKLPPSKNIAPPTYYWLFVLCNGVPNRDGHAVFVK